MEHSTEIELYQSREKLLLEHISAKISKISPRAGDIVILQPEKNYYWTSCFADYLNENLSSMLPEDVIAWVIVDPNIKINLKEKDL